MLAQIEIGIISLSDTVGQAVPEDIAYLYHALIPAFSKIEFGAHFHTHPKWGENSCCFRKWMSTL